MRKEDEKKTKRKRKEDEKKTCLRKIFKYLSERHYYRVFFFEFKQILQEKKSDNKIIDY